MLIQIFHSFSVNGVLKIALGAAIPTFLMIVVVAAKTIAEREALDAVEIGRLVAQGGFTGMLIALITSSLTNLQDRSTLDKNRIAYLRFGKQSVAIGKVTGASLQFTIQTVLAYAGVLVVSAAGKLDLSALDPGKIIVYLIVFTLYYTMVQTGTRYIVAGVPKITTRILLLCA